MSDDLVEMARLAQHDERMSTGALYGDLADRIEELEERLEKEMQDLDAADRRAKRLQARIKELEAKLAKAMKALDEAMYFIDIDEEDILKQAGMYRIVKSYAELGALIPAEWADALKRVAELTGGKDD